MASTNGENGSHKSAHVSVDEFVQQQAFDYVICGGGTAGLVLAARLTEDPSVTVGVIEAGKNRLGDPVVDIPAGFTQLVGREEYDYCYKSTPQAGNGNKVHQLNRGKLLGGSSGINFLTYVRGSAQDYDNWAELANDPAWSATETAQYMRKHQTLEPIDERITDRTGMHIVSEFHGTSGPIRTSFNDAFHPLEDDVIKAAEQSVGLTEKPVDPWSGDHVGFFKTMGLIARSGPAKGMRSYAARGYFQANEHRPNLRLVTESVVSRVILENKVATGVEFISGGQTFVVKAKREVIVSGGTIASPQILELSGIGDPEVLRAAGVECLVDLPSVGTNLQDHVLAAQTFELPEGVQSGDALHNPEVMAMAQKILAEQQGGPLTGMAATQGFFPCQWALEDGELEEILTLIEDTPAPTPFQQRQRAQVVQHLKSPRSANLQFVLLPASSDLPAGVPDQTKIFCAPAPGAPHGITFATSIQYPVARGWVHITSSDPHRQPDINPNYMNHPADVAVLAAGVNFISKVIGAPAMAGKLGKRTLPSPDTDLTTVQGRRGYIQEHVMGLFHLCGSCAMGSTVDSRLRVEGVQRLRVVDASVFPNNVSGNIVSSVYMLAEKAADMIKEDWATRQ